MQAVRLIILLVVILAANDAFAQRVETQMEIAGPVGPLGGTMLSPNADVRQAALIIPGAGPTNRDGVGLTGLLAAPYRLLAEEMSEIGVATVRIDKRMFGSASPAVDPNAVTIPDYVSDIHAWIEVVRQRTGVRCVWLIGHSEGGLVALAAAQSPQDICGLILISTPGRRMSDLLRSQIRDNPANEPLIPVAEHILAELEAGRRVEANAIPPPLQPLFHPAVQGFLMSVFSYDPRELLRHYEGPVMVMQGDSDFQVSMQDAQALISARPDIEFVPLAGVNHVLKLAPMDDRRANIATYSNPSLPLAPGISDHIAQFIRAH